MNTPTSPLADSQTRRLADSPLLVLVGPTAVGKTALSLKLAGEFGGEIVSADSRLFYRGMDLGTAKPAEAECALIPHHLIDICNPDETLTLGAYQRLAYETIDDILARGRLPILVGGTGQYVTAVVEGWGIPRVPPQIPLRQVLEKAGVPELARWLRTLDPEAAEQVDPRNVRRLIRALEVILVSGRHISELRRKKPLPYDVLMVGLTRERTELYARIDARVERMMAAGLLDEVKALRQAGYGRRLPAMSGLGYRQLVDYLEGEMSLAEAVERIKFDTHRFVRQQYTWFRLDNPRIHWFDAGEEGVEEVVISFVRRWLEEIA